MLGIDSSQPLASMPTLGFLKKKRTKDSSGSKDIDSDFPVKDVSAPALADSSKPQDRPSSTRVTPDGPAAAYAGAPHLSSEAKNAEHMTPTALENPLNAQGGHTSFEPAAYHQTQQNVASIHNLINQTNSAPAAHSSRDGDGDGDGKGSATNGGVMNPGIVSAAVPVQNPVRTTKGKYTLSDFAIQRTLGTGSFGRVHLVQSKHNQRYYAIKVLKKAQVVKMKQVEHTNDERRMLQKVRHPFLITLWGTFQDSRNLYMVMDFVEGGELFSLLRKSQVRQDRQRVASDRVAFVVLIVA